MTIKPLTKAQEKAQEKAAAQEAKDIAMLEKINATLDNAFEDDARAATETRKNGKLAYKAMDKLFASILFDLAKALGWSGFTMAMEALKAHDRFKYFGGPYNDNIIKNLINGFTATLGAKAQREADDKARRIIQLQIHEILEATDNAIDAKDKLLRITALNQKLALIGS